MHNPGDEIDPNEDLPSTDTGDDATSNDGVVTQLNAYHDQISQGSAEENATNTNEAIHSIPVVRQSLPQEFWGFIVHNKAWWMTPIILVLALMVSFILLAESSPVLPFIYTVL